MQSKVITSSKALFYFCLSFIIGILLESVVKIPQMFVCGFLLLGIIFICLSCFLKKINFAIGFCILFLAIGVLRMQISEFNISNDQLSKLNGTKDIALTGTISSEPDVRDTFQKLKIKVGGSIVLVTTDIYPEYKYLDTIKITGNLETPTEDEEFSYKKYLMKDGIYSVMFYPKVELISEMHSHSVFTFIYEKILFLKQKIRDSIQYNFSPPESSIMEGTILGDNGAMSQDLKDKLSITGLRHIIAVSGTHVIILSSIIMSLLLALGLKRTDAFYFAITFICFYIILTGLPASGIRAGVMGGLYLLAQKLGRQSLGIRVVVMACAVILIFNPLLLFYDVGFQLSFLAVIGLIYLEPIFTKMIKVLIKDLPAQAGKAENIIKIVSATFAAQVLTIPIILYSFGNVSFISPITNLLVLPVVYWLMIFGFLSSFAGIFLPIVGWILSIPCYFLLRYFLWVIDFFSQPWAIKTFENVHWIWLVFLYLIIIFATRFLNKKFAEKF